MSRTTHIFPFTNWAWAHLPAPDPASPEQGDSAVKTKGLCGKHPWPGTYPPSILEMRGPPPPPSQMRAEA